MRAVVQRVSRASCTVDGQITGQIDLGLLVFLGVADSDQQSDLDYIVDKMTNLRIFPDGDGKMNLSVNDISGGVLLISQFTLYGDCRKGRRPDFTAAGKPDFAKEMYEKAIEAISATNLNVQTGVFAAHMHIESINDGPVTMLLDSTKIL